MMVLVRCRRPPSGALQLCSCVWFCGQPAAASHRAAGLRPASSLQALPREGEGGTGAAEAPAATPPWLSFRGSCGLCPSAPTEGPGVRRGRHPDVAERRGNRRSESNCTPTPSVRDCVGERNKGQAGCYLPALSLRTPAECAPSDLDLGRPPAAQCSPTLAFFFHTACRQTRYSAPNVELARGQGLAADRLPPHLAERWPPLREQQLARPLRKRAAREPPGSSGSRHAWGLLWPWASEPSCFHSLCVTTSPTGFFPSSAVLIHLEFLLLLFLPTPPVNHGSHPYIDVLLYHEALTSPLTPQTLLAPAVFSLLQQYHPLERLSAHILSHSSFPFVLFLAAACLYPHRSTQTVLTKDPTPTML